ncbi:hypothetical protein POM88_000728 [Heracleum sosnowskyi]|uniref:P-type ATPase N-terminal domain-containing protein n=1 Tax=Heracleum sosnowskyi TaxID=360622 RepID=A0AAD8JC41_9APIA|nr:hypothetical protein POM88_000728 [Heracleum sosnowskyi]
MAEQSKSNRRKGKVKWSKLYTFSCLKPNVDDQQLLGQPGFSRVVFCNKPELHKTKPYKYPNNYISTTKYNVVSFLPKALFEQFRRVANLYFLLAAILSATSLAPFTPTSMIAPLVFFVGLSMIKEAVEDWSRFLQYTYDEIPHHYVWNDSDNIWNMRKRGKQIGRLFYTHHSTRELWYLRLLLTKVCGPTSFQCLRTVNGKVYPNFQEACKAYGLLDDDNEWHQVLQQCSVSGFALQIRQLFVHIMVNCRVSDLRKLWDDHCKDMIDDILMNRCKQLKKPHLLLNEKQLEYYALADGKIMKANDREFEDDICIPAEFCIVDNANSVDDMIESTFPDFTKNYQNPKYLSERAILTPTNNTVAHVNALIVEKIHGETVSYFSNDIAEDFPELSPEYLQSINVAGMPPHELKLKNSRIHAYIAAQLAPKYQQHLKEGQIYILQNFSVKYYNGDQTSHAIRSEKHIYFTQDTNLTKDTDSGLEIEAQSFDLFLLSDVEKLKKDNRFLIDVVGVLEDGPQKISYKKDEVEKHNVKFTITDGRTSVNVTFFNEFGDSFMTAMNQKLEPPIIIIIACAKINEWNDEVCLTNYQRQDFI